MTKPPNMTQTPNMTQPPKERLLAALITITAERGLDQVSIREVAAEAGVSVGTVQYYCRTKDEMLLMAFRHILGRITDRAGRIERSGTVGSVLQRAMEEFLPIDDLRRHESRVYLAFAARAATTPALAEVHHELLKGMRSQSAAAFALAQERGEAVTEFDAKEAAAESTALVDGMMLHMVTDPNGLRPKTAVRILGNHLRRYVEF